MDRAGLLGLYNIMQYNLIRRQVLKCCPGAASMSMSTVWELATPRKYFKLYTPSAAPQTSHNIDHNKQRVGGQ